MSGFVGLAHGAWRLLPRELRRSGMTRTAAMIAARPGESPAVSAGAIVAGDLGGQNGIAESSRILAESLRSRGLLHGTMPLGLPSVVPAFAGQLAPGAAVLAVINAPFLPVGLARLRPRNLLRDRRVIGVWAWELPVAPREWGVGARFVHEVWAPSRFAAAAFEPIARGRVRVVPFPLAELMPFEVVGVRQDFGLPSDRFVVLSAFNLASSYVRKNPLGTIAAFKAAFGARDDVLLVLKISGVTDYPEDLAEIRAAIGEVPNVRLLAENLPEPMLRGLIAASDVVLSLHRSEGFGLIPAVAALLGVPVVATNFSGVLDFLEPGSSGLVGYRLVQARDPRGVYDLPGALWAEPDVAEAVDWLRLLAGDAGLRATMGSAARRHASAALGGTALDAALEANGIA